MNFTPVLNTQAHQGGQHFALPAVKLSYVFKPLSVTELSQSFNQIPQLVRISLTGLAWSFKLIDRDALNSKPLNQVVILSTHDDLPFAVKLKSRLERLMPCWEYPKIVFIWNEQMACDVLGRNNGGVPCLA